jgi:hypothetical protein
MISQQQIVMSNCQSQSADVSYVSSQGTTFDIFSDSALGNYVYGQSFIPNKTSTIQSIKVTLASLPDPSSATLKIRIGNSPDLSTNYETEETISLADYSVGNTIEIIFSTKPTITSGVTKYFMIYNTGGYSSRFKLYRNYPSGYAGGTAYSSKTGLTNVIAESDIDLSFEVMVCD